MSRKQLATLGKWEMNGWLSSQVANWRTFIDYYKRHVPTNPKRLALTKSHIPSHKIRTRQLHPSHPSSHFAIAPFNHQGTLLIDFHQAIVIPILQWAPSSCSHMHPANHRSGENESQVAKEARSTSQA
jgi:hypothetical protein